jgi:hypothetical protein
LVALVLAGEFFRAIPILKTLHHEIELPDGKQEKPVIVEYRHDCTLQTFSTDATKPSSKRIAASGAIGEHPRVAVRDVLKIEQFGNKPWSRGSRGYEQRIEYPELLMTSLFRSIAVPDVGFFQPFLFSPSEAR